METVKPLTELELSFVTLVHQHWSLTGTLLTSDETWEKYSLAKSDFDVLYRSDNVQAALAERGIVFERQQAVGHLKSSWSGTTLTPQQLIVANTMLDLIDTRSNKKKLQDLGVSSHKYSSWLRDSVFREYLKERAETLLGDNQHEASLALMDKVASGDIKAIEFYMEMTGRYTRASNKGANNAVDFQQLLIRIVEIITDEVDDPAIAARIAERLKSLSTARTVAGELLGEQELTPLPLTAPVRQLTPELQGLLIHGEGVNI